MIQNIYLLFIANIYGLPEVPATADKLKLIANIVLLVLGGVAVIVLIIGGMDFMFSQGEPDKVSRARNTIIYAMVGLIIAIMAGALVNFVITAAT